VSAYAGSSKNLKDLNGECSSGGEQVRYLEHMFLPEDGSCGGAAVVLLRRIALDMPTGFLAGEGRQYRGTSLIRNSPPPQDRRRSLGMVLR
jgi:hypothetical protein